jgi:hypothetical protein
MLEVIYKDHRFQSTLEAKWAVFFDTLGISFECKKEVFVYDDQPYCPTFWLPEQKCWVDVRAERSGNEVDARAMKLASVTRQLVYLFFGEVPLPEPTDGKGECIDAYFWDEDEVRYDKPYWWCECFSCHSVGICFNGWTERLPCCHAERRLPNLASPRLIEAYTAARSALFESVDNLDAEKAKSEDRPSLEPWKIEMLQQLLEANSTEVEVGQRVYISSEAYGNHRYHIVDRRYDGIQIEQLEMDEKWSKRMNFHRDEVPRLLKSLLTWYLEDMRKVPKGTSTTMSDVDDLGELDDHPF